MKILHLIPFLTGGGAERQLLYLSREQARAGHDVHIGYMLDGPAGPTTDWSHARLHTVPAGKTANPHLWIRLSAQIRRLRPDIIQTWSHQLDIAGGCLASLFKMPWVIREANSAGCYPPSWRNRLRIAAIRRSSLIISNSPGGDRYWSSLHPHQSRRVILNGLPVETINSVTPHEAHVSLPSPEGPLAVFSGRFDTQKNVDRLIDALAEVMAARPLSAVLCGDGVLRSALEEKVRSYRLEDRILMPGHLQVRQVWALMKRADVFTFVSLFEGLPNAVMEAMACGVPLVVSDIPAHRDFLDESCAAFARPDDPKAIAREITRVLETPRALNPRAMAARERACGWSIAEMARQYELAYQDVLRARTP